METTIDADESGVTVGIDAAGFGASISSSGILSLDIGVAGVEIDVSNPNNSSIDFGFGIFSIEGRQEGCQVILKYYIAGVEAMSETRTVPDCTIDDPEPPPKPPPKGDDEVSETPLIPNPYERFRAVAYPKNDYGLSTFFSTDINYFRSQTSWEISERSAPNIFYNPNRGWDFSVNCTGKVYHYDYHVMNGIRYTINGEDNSFPGGCWRDINYKYPSPFMPPSWYREKEINGRPEAGLEGKGYQINAVIVRDLKSFSRSQSWASENSQATEVNRIQWDIYYEQISNKVPSVTKIPPLNRTPKMDDNCCEMIEEIHQVLGIREMQSKGFIIPNRMIAPNAKGNTQLKTFVDIYEWQVRQTDHLGIHPFKAIVQDYNAAQKGDQKLELQMVNATAFAKTITELLLENKGDAATRLNLMVRTAIAVGQILNVVSIGAKRTREIMRFLGIPVKEKTFNVKMPFDFSFGQRRKKGKGFATGVNQKGVDALGINTEKATEELLPEFMTDEEQPIIVEMYDDSQPNLVDLIQKLLGRI